MKDKRKILKDSCGYPMKAPLTDKFCENWLNGTEEMLIGWRQMGGGALPYPIAKRGWLVTEEEGGERRRRGRGGGGGIGGGDDGEAEERSSPGLRLT